MGGGWRSYKGAPASGEALCALADIPDPGTLCLRRHGFPVLLVRRGDDLRAYVNACPHQYLPLDHKGDRLLSADGATLRCTNHQAGFSAESGVGVDGLGVGERLDAIPVAVRSDGTVAIA